MSSYTPNLLRDEMCESRRKMERPIEIQRHLVCAARKMTKALPPVISFASFHPLIIAVSFSLVVPVPFSPPSRSLFLAFSAASSQYFILPLLPSFLQLFLSSLMTFFVPLLPPSSSHPLSSPPSPIPHLKTSTLRRLLIFLPPPQPPPPPSPTLCTHNLPLSYSVFLLSLRLFFHVFSPVCCDHRQAGDSCNSRQLSCGHRQREGGGGGGGGVGGGFWEGGG